MIQLMQMVCIGCLILPGYALAQADDAAAIYLHAAKIVADNTDNDIMCPSSSNMEYRSYPPYEPKWIEREKAAYAFNVEARNLSHQARSIDDAKWPAMTGPNATLYLNKCRALSNDLADAAQLQAWQGDGADAIETIRDLLHLADVMLKQPEHKIIVKLVSIGIRAEAMDRLNVIASGMVLTSDAKDTKDVQATVARDLLKQLLDHPDAKTYMLSDDAERAVDAVQMDASTERMIETAKRVFAESDMAALSLACHLYRFDTGQWPDSIDQLHKYIPTVPIDAWGDGKQTLGYTLVKHGLPDGNDRPLVYCRCMGKDGLFFRRDEPEYRFYGQDGSKLPISKQKHGGQFRDVASWAPPEGYHPVPVTQPLN